MTVLVALPFGHEIEYELDSYYTEWQCDKCGFLHFRSDPVRLVRTNNKTAFFCVEHGADVGALGDDQVECECHCHRGDFCDECGELVVG